MKIQVSIPLTNSQSRLLEGSMFTVGRVEGNDIVIPNAKISSRHGRFVARENVLIFEDLNSRNGSLVERAGQRQVIVPDTPAVLQEGDQLLLGDLQNPIVIEVLVIESEPSGADATVVASRSVIDDLPVLHQFNEPSKQTALFALLRNCSELDNPDDVFEESGRTILSVFPQAKAVRLWMMAPDGGWHEVNSYTGTGPIQIEEPSQTLLSRALEAKEVIAYTPNPEEASKSVIGLRSIALVPLVTRGDSFGVLVVESPKGIFLQEALDWLSILSTYMTASLVSAQRFRALRLSEAALDEKREQLSVEQAMDRPIIGESEALRKALNQLKRVAKTDTSVLISGETGTGKELAARFVHAHSSRRGKTFVAVNCGAISEQLLSSELFGHVKGAFTGAERDRKGLFEAANSGTIFLDEIGEISPTVQVQLLRVLQEREFHPVGSSTAVRVDVRIVAATNRDLMAEVEAGNFREDLFYRLNVFPVNLPPLRKRDGDIVLLAERFREMTSSRYGRYIPGFTQDAIGALMSAQWQGNIRQLEHEIERAVILTDDGELIGTSALSIDDKKQAAPDEGDLVIPSAGPLKSVISDFEKKVIERRLDIFGGNRSRTSESLSISRQALQTKLAKWKQADAIQAESDHFDAGTSLDQD